MLILLATMNENKVDEIKKIVPDLPFKNIRDFCDEWDVEEDGDSFEENAMKKAVVSGNYFGLYTVADDSGLEIKALEGFPGVRSSRFMASNEYTEKMTELLKRMEAYETEEERYAQFRTVACFYDPLENKKMMVEGIVKGTLSKEIKGSGGFGYDPIFIPEGFEKTFGELPETVKNSFSHRARAFAILKERLKEEGYIK
ncbi:MAG: RdgB/HAM1 family non-canonical purine NTP pyrophosphatase [Thermotogota bacterium]